MTVAAYLNKGGGGGSLVTNSIFHGDQSIRLVYETPCVSDSQVCAREAECSGLSRKGQIIHTEWTLHNLQPVCLAVLQRGLETCMLGYAAGRP